MRFFLRTTLLTTLLLALCSPKPTRAQGWSDGPSMSVARSDAAVAVLNGELYVMGGRSTTGQALGAVEKFDPVTDQWTTVASLREERYSAAAASLGGQIVLMGGTEEDGGVTDDVEVYVPGENDWESFDSLGRERTGPAAAVLDGRAFALGGASEGGAFLTSCEAYDSDDESWYIYPDWTLDPGRASFGAAVVGEAVYTAGGFSQFGPVDRVQRYDLANGSVELDALLSPRGRLALVYTGGAMGGDLFAIGGEDADDVLATVERYDIAQDTWTSVASLQTARAGAVAAYLDGAIYVVGGEDAFGNALRTVEVYRLPTSGEVPASAAAFALGAAYPNPFADRTTLSFKLAESGPVTVTVYDVQGRRVATLADRAMPGGPHRVTWDGRAADGRPLPAGVYVVRLVGAGGTAVAKLTLVR